MEPTGIDIMEKKELKDHSILSSSAMNLRRPMTVIAVTKGNREIEINVHTSVLQDSCSGFFQSELVTLDDPSGDANDTSRVLIGFGDIEVVKAYIHWLYSGKIPRLHESVDELFAFFAYAYVFGNEIGDPNYKNAVIETMAVYARDNSTFNPLGAIDIICEGTQESSPAWRFMAVVFAHMASDQDDWINTLERCPKVFKKEVLRIVLNGRTIGSPVAWLNNLPSYYEEVRQ